MRTSRERLELRDFRTSIEAALNCEIPSFGTRVPTWYVLAAAFDHMVDWVNKGKLPPTAPRIEVSQLGSPGVPSVLARSSLGIALGGIRLAAVDAPTALNVGENTALDAASSACFRWGYSIPFDISTLNTLCPRHEEYVDQVTKVTKQNLRDGYILEPDATQTVEDAVSSDVGGADGKPLAHSQ